MRSGGAAAMPVGAVVPSLVRWGVSPDADLVYRALVTVGPQAVRQLSADLGMPRRRVTDAIEELATNGAVLAARTGGGRRSSHPELWFPNAPEEVLRRLRRSRLRVVDPWDLAQRHLATIAGMDLPSDVAEAQRSQVRLLRGIDLIRERIAHLAGQERHEHLAINPEQALSAPSVAAAAPLDRALLLRGGTLLTLGVPPADGDTAGLRSPELERLGAMHRLAGELPLKAMVFDRKIAIVPLNPLQAGNGVLEIADPALVNSVVSLFTREWQQARDPHRPDVPRVSLTPRERALVDLLAAGRSDAVVSRTLGLSTRTVGYTLRGLMDRLNVENRFQLGLALGAQGIYTAPEPTEG